VKRRITRIDNAEKLGFSCLWHVDGNQVEGYPEISANNWAGGVDFEEGTSAEKNRSRNAFDAAPVTTQSAKEAY